MTYQKTTPAKAPSIDDTHAKIADELAWQIHQDTHQNALQDARLTLSEYLHAVEYVIKDTFNHHVWVQAEVRAVSSKGGHYYLELAQKDSAGKILASCRATLWKFTALSVLKRFTQTTGSELKAGMDVLIKVQANFHAQYGFSINIADIDPNYTMGALAAAYQQMVNQLHSEGLTLLNKRLPTPFDIEHVIVISPQNAAGLGDFRTEADRLSDCNACQFHYHHATFQGNHAPSEIRLAINQSMTQFVQTHQRLPDLLVIIRGGGAVGDLAYLNDYDLAALVAEQPVPVWIGIGHERDKVLLDEVAHTRFDTPSKVVAGIANHLSALVHKTKQAMSNINNLSQKYVATLHKNSTAQMHAISSSANRLIQTSQLQCHRHLNTINQQSKHHIKLQKIHNAQQFSRIKQHAQQQLKDAKRHTEQAWQHHRLILPKLRHLSEQCRQLQGLILVQHPRRTLSKGFALVYRQDPNQNSSQLITSTTQVSSGDHLTIKLHDGTISTDARYIHHNAKNT